MHKNRGQPKQFLLISTARDGPKLEAVKEALGQPGDAISSLRLGENLPDPNSFDAVVLEGDQHGLAANYVERLVRYVEGGGSVLAINAAPSSGDGVLAEKLLGCRGLSRLPLAELFGKPTNDGHELARRITSEFSIFDSFAPLQPLNSRTNMLLKVRVRFQDQPAVVEHLLGKGRVVVSALGATEEALRTPQLRTMLRRSLQRCNGEYIEKALGVAIIGYGPLGGVGYGHGIAVTSTAGLALTAICDRNQARLEAASADFPQLKYYATAEEVARDSKVDVVIIATPPSSHTDLALLMLRSGKHVVCEKPLCLSVREADELLAAAMANGLVLTVNQNRRWDPDFLAIRRAVKGGMIGEVFNMETFVGSFAHPCREWHSEASISGGTEYDWGSHHIDWILEIMPGLPKRVAANGHKRVWHDVSNVDQVRVRLLWEDGREAEFVYSDVAGIRRPKFYIQATEGTIAGYYRSLISERIEPGRGYVRQESHHAEAPAELVLMRYDFSSGALSEHRLPLVGEEPYAFHRNLADHLHFPDLPLAITFESVRRVIVILEAAHLSAERGGVPLAPAFP